MLKFVQKGKKKYLCKKNNRGCPFFLNIKRHTYHPYFILSIMTIDEYYMSRCIQIAKNGRQNSQPNPMVGAVIVYFGEENNGQEAIDFGKDISNSAQHIPGKIIGEGYHIRQGEGHAEVNACASVLPENEHLLKESTIYVSLEPCSHFGKTPPCADLLVSKGFKRCVVGCQDPNERVQGRGIKRLRDAGIEVVVGVLESECLEFNKRFMTFHGKCRPMVTLKWAQSADGFIDGHISTPYTQMICHKRRAEHQAILVGRHTYDVDQPGLDVREWKGVSPKKYVVSNDPNFTPSEDFERLVGTVSTMLSTLYAEGIQTVLVEGGSKLHQSFIDSGLWDECYVEIGDEVINGSIPAPILKNARLVERKSSFGRIITKYEPV